MSSKIYSNTTNYNRCEHSMEYPYTMLSNDLIKDQRLNLLEVGIMTYLLSNSDTYIINTSYIQRICGIGQDRFYKAIKHLTDLGYLIKNQRKGSTNWIVNENPSYQPKNENNSENTSVESTISENTSIESTISENTIGESTGITIIKETTNNPLSKNEKSINEPNINISVVAERVENPSLGLSTEKTSDLGLSEKIISKVKDIDYKPSANPSYQNTPRINTINTEDSLPVKNTPKVVKDPRFEAELQRNFKASYIQSDYIVKMNYEQYSEQYPNTFISIDQYERIVFYSLYQINDYGNRNGEIPTNENVNRKMIYSTELFHHLKKNIQEVITEMKADLPYTERVLKLKLAV